MALSVVDLYVKILPRTNCKDCGFPTCIAFAGKVVSEKLPLHHCPHIPGDILEKAQAELDDQYRQGKWLKKDMAAEALGLAREKAGSMSLEQIAARIGGVVEDESAPGPLHGIPHLRLPYFSKELLITLDRVSDSRGEDLSRNEQTFVFIHMAAGGTQAPTGHLKSLKEFPNTVSKIVSMKSYVEDPLKKTFSGRTDLLTMRCRELGGVDVQDRYEAPDIAFQFRVFPRVYVTLLFWDENEGFEPEAKLMFDETIINHMDIEAIMFMSEHLANLLIRGPKD